MSDDVDEEEKTEDPSGKRISKAAEEGDIPVGRDANQTLALIAGLAALVAVSSSLRDVLVLAIRQATMGLATHRLQDMLPLVMKAGLLSLTAIAAAALMGIAASTFQYGFRTWPEKLAPDLSKLFNISKVTQSFSKDFAIDLLAMLLKVTFVVYMGWSVFGDQFRRLPQLFETDTAEMLPLLFVPLYEAGKRMIGALMILAAGDYWLTRHRFMKKMKMTKEEVKREVKSDEGDPKIKGRRRRKAMELLKQRARAEVPRADALVANPTHVAVAIRYRKSEAASPRVTAKGMGATAELMKDLARSNGIPIVTDIALARLLYKRVRVGNEIPAQTFKAVAAILVFVYKVTGRRPQ